MNHGAREIFIIFHFHMEFTYSTNKEIKKHGSPTIEASDTICILWLCLRWMLIFKRDGEVVKKKKKSVHTFALGSTS